jgi:hypothetical protein
MREQGAQVVEVEQQPAVVVGELEHDFQHARLGIVEFEHAREQGRADLADRAAHRMAELAVQVPEDHRAGFAGVSVDADFGDPRLQLVVAGARGGEAGDVALDVGHEHRHADAREAFRDGHQRDRLAGAGRARDQAVAIAESRLQPDLALACRKRIRRGDGLAYENRVHGLPLRKMTGFYAIAPRLPRFPRQGYPASSFSRRHCTSCLLLPSLSPAGRRLSLFR